jgi:cation:H+ antiporter
VSPLLLWSGVFVVAVLALVKSADWFTDGAEELGVYLGIPSYVVGVTIVAIGTSLPELISSIIAVNKGNPEIVVGNVVGSNITNIFLVLALAAILAGRLAVTYEIIHVDLPMLVASAALLVFVAWDGVVGWGEGLLLIAGAVVYLLYAVSVSRQRARAHKEIAEDIAEEYEIEPGKLDPWVWPRIIGGAVLLYFAAFYTIESVVELATILEVGTELIAMSAVALGTSLPELVVSGVAARRGNLEIAMGNVLGSSVFNSFAVVGIPALMVPLPVPPLVLTVGLPIMVVATLLFFFMAQDREITRWEGSLLGIFYILYLGKLFELL